MNQHSLKIIQNFVELISQQCKIKYNICRIRRSKIFLRH